MHTELMLAASVAALALGPFLFRVAGRHPTFLRGLDGFVVVAILLLVGLEVLPAAIDQAGLMAVGAVAVGLVLPLVVARLGRAQSGSANEVIMWSAVVGLALHALMDGMALAGAHGHGHGHGHGLEAAVVLHRVPVGLAVVLLVEPRAGARAAWGLIGVVVAATISGFLLGRSGLLHLEPTWSAAFEAVVAGLLLHVVFERPQHLEEEDDCCGSPIVGERWHAGLGGLLALVAFGSLSAAGWIAEGVGASAELQALWHLLVESAPALLLAYLVAGAVGGLFGEATASWLGRGSAGGQALRGVTFGLPLPLCSCGVVPVYRSLVRRGVPATAGMAFLIATPELGLDAIFLSLPLLGVGVTGMRIAAAFFVALLVGIVVGRLVPAVSVSRAAVKSDEPSASIGDRLRAGLRTGYVDVFDDTIAWIGAGLLIAAFIAPHLDASSLSSVPRIAQVALFAVIGMPVYVCASGATPLAAVLIAAGLSPGAAVAFLITGPATNATTYGTLKQLHGHRVALLFVVVVFAATVAIGYAVDLLFPVVVTPELTPETMEHGWLGTVSAFALLALTAVSLLRQGPRGMLSHLASVGGVGGGHDHDGDDCGHDHGDDCGHDHGDHCGHDH